MQQRKAAKERFDEIEAFINDYREQYGTAPSMQKIGEAVGLCKATVFHYLSMMNESGRLERRGSKGYITRESSKGMAPIVGRIACGTPLFAEENIEEYVRLPEALFGKGELFLLRAQGDSMVEAGIDDGDLVVIRRQDTANIGQIVVALVEDEATLKRYYPEPEHGRVRLHPENERMEDIYVRDCLIQGVAVKLIKNMQ